MDFDKNRIFTLVATAGAGIVVGYLGWKFLSCLQLVSADIGKPDKSPKEEKVAPKIIVEIDDKRQYFLKEMRTGEKCLSFEKYEEAANHFANAMLVSEKKESLEEVLVASLPKPIFEMFQKALKQKSDEGVVIKVSDKEKPK